MTAVMVNTRIKFICILPEEQICLLLEKTTQWKRKFPRKMMKKMSDSAFGSEFTVFFGGILMPGNNHKDKIIVLKISYRIAYESDVLLDNLLG